MPRLRCLESNTVTQEARQKVILEAISWLGTPFRHRAKIKGRHGGVDCGQFLCGVFENAGIVDPIVLPEYPMQWALHQREELYLKELLKYTREIPVSEARSADIIMFHVGRASSHGALMLEPWPGRLIHSTNRPTGIGVCFTDGRRDGGLQAELQKHRNFPPRFFTVW